MWSTATSTSQLVNNTLVRPQFLARDFKAFIREVGMSHARTAPYYPQSNGKIERYHKTLKSEGIRPLTPLSLADARQVFEDFVAYYNEVRLHSAIGYVTPKTRLEDRHELLFKQRDAKLEAAREARRQRRAQHHPTPAPTPAL